MVLRRAPPRRRRQSVVSLQNLGGKPPTVTAGGSPEIKRLDGSGADGRREDGRSRSAVVVGREVGGGRGGKSINGIKGTEGGVISQACWDG